MRSVFVSAVVSVAVVSIAVLCGGFRKADETGVRREPPDDIKLVLPLEYPLWGGTALREGETDKREEWDTTEYTITIHPRLDRDWGVKKYQAFELVGADEEGRGGTRGENAETKFFSTDRHRQARNEDFFCFRPERGKFYGIEVTLCARFTDSDPRLIDRWLKESSIGILPERD